MAQSNKFLLRTAAIVAVVIGAAGSLGLTLYAGRQNPSRLLMVLFAVWVTAPFLALGFATMAAKRWPVPAQATLYIAMFAISLGSLAVFAKGALRPAQSQAAFVFVVTPLLSWLVIALVIGAVALISARLWR